MVARFQVFLVLVQCYVNQSMCPEFLIIHTLYYMHNITSSAKLAPLSPTDTLKWAGGAGTPFPSFCHFGLIPIISFLSEFFSALPVTQMIDFTLRYCDPLWHRHECGSGSCLHWKFKVSDSRQPPLKFHKPSKEFHCVNLKACSNPF